MEYLILKIYQFMGSLDSNCERIEFHVGLRPDGKKTVRSSRQNETDLVERIFSPKESPRVSPFKGVKAAADERRSIKRGRVAGDSGLKTPPPKRRGISETPLA